jgi:hypothetical protein
LVGWTSTIRGRCASDFEQAPIRTYSIRERLRLQVVQAIEDDRLPLLIFGRRPHFVRCKIHVMRPRPSPDPQTFLNLLSSSGHGTTPTHECARRSPQIALCAGRRAFGTLTLTGSLSGFGTLTKGYPRWAAASTSSTSRSVSSRSWARRCKAAAIIIRTDLASGESAVLRMSAMLNTVRHRPFRSRARNA